MTGHADDQGTRMAGLPDFDQRLVTSFHSAPDYIKTAIRTLLKIEMADSEAQAQVSPEGKHKHASRRDEESKVEEARKSEVLSRAESINFRSIKNPEVPFHCIIQVNGGHPDGSLFARDTGYSIRVTLDGGACHSPNIGLRFRHPGSGGPEVGRVSWHIYSRAEDRWVIQDLEYVLVSRAPYDKAVNHATVINQCVGATLNSLMCITLQVTPHAGGSCQRPARETAEAIKMYFNAIFFKKKDYTIRIWFLKPWTDIAELDTRCLSVMQYLFDQRQEPLSLAQDTTGAYFTNSTNAVRYGTSAVVPQHQWDPWTDSFNPPQSMVPVEVEMSPTGGNASKRTAGTSALSRAYWGAAAASSGRAPLIAAKRTGPATAAYPVEQPILDDEDGGTKEEDDEIKKEEGDAPATDRSPEGSEAIEEAEDFRSAQPARGMFSGTSTAGDEVARAHTGYYMRDGNEEDEGSKGNENFTPASPSGGLFSKLDSAAVETPPYWLDFEEDDEEEEQ